MSGILLLSFVVCLVAVTFAVVGVTRTKDWRFLILLALVTLLGVFEGLALMGENPTSAVTFVPGDGEISTLLFSILALVSILFLSQTIRNSERTNALHQANEARIRNLLNNVTFAIVTTDDRGVIQTFNPPAEEMFGYTESEMIGRNVMVLMTDIDRDHHDTYIQSYLTTGVGRILGVRPRELWAMRKDGSRFPMELGVSEIPNSEHIFIGSMRDISHRKEIERQLSRSQRLKTVGQMTGGVAHDFNNLLMALQLNLEMLEPAVTEEHRKYYDSALHATSRGGDLTQRLLAFSRSQVLAPEVINVNERVSAMTTLLRRTLGDDIEIELVLGGGLWNAEVDAPQLENSLLNLAINARDAMPGGGKLTIETANIRLDENYAMSRDEVRAGQYVMIGVTDNGTGMPEDVRLRVFEPFFTTKGVGAGSGLGLSMVYGFLKQSDGHVEIYSEEGDGTMVKLYFPKAVSQTTQAPEPSMLLPLTGGIETILVVEDDADVRVILEASLRQLGYEVYGAGDGTEAIDRLDVDGVKPDLILADVVMPGMSGREVAEAVVERVPECRVLYMSGYTSNVIVHQGRLDEGVQLLNKPYTQEQLAQTIRQILDE